MREAFCRKNHKQAQPQPDTWKEGKGGGAKLVPVTAHQLLHIPRGVLVNDYSISGLTFLF